MPKPLSCTLSDRDVIRQRGRYARLARTVAGAERDGDVLVVDFAPSFDRAVLEETIAVERDCCPFFRFSFDGDRRRLEVGVEHDVHAPALAAIAEQLGVDRRGSW